MSSTKRSDVRQPDDFYSTPAWCTRAILPVIITPSVRHVLDPAAGEGAILDEVKRMYHGAVGTSGYETDHERALVCGAHGHGVGVADALASRRWVADAVVMNPPFALASEFVARAISEVPTVACVLRLGFLASMKRATFWRDHPADVFVLPRRPSFTEHLHWTRVPDAKRCLRDLPGKRKPTQCERVAAHTGPCMTIGSDSADYMWAVWAKGSAGGRWRVLEVG